MRMLKGKCSKNTTKITNNNEHIKLCIERGRKLFALKIAIYNCDLHNDFDFAFY